MSVRSSGSRKAISTGYAVLAEAHCFQERAMRGPTPRHPFIEYPEGIAMLTHPVTLAGPTKGRRLTFTRDILRFWLSAMLHDLRYRRRKARKQIPRQRMLQPPGHRHRQLALMPDVRRGPQEPERPVIRS
jgi:hypothetical protein